MVIFRAFILNCCNLLQLKHQLVHRLLTKILRVRNKVLLKWANLTFIVTCKNTYIKSTRFQKDK